MDNDDPATTDRSPGRAGSAVTAGTTSPASTADVADETGDARASEDARGTPVGTRQRLLDAALATLRTAGITAASARTIAGAAGANQASIYYHFGSLNDLLLAACEANSHQRAQSYRARLEGIETLPELVAVARELHARDIEEGNLVAVSQLLAGLGGETELQPRTRAIFAPWIEVVGDAVRRVLDGSGLEELFDPDDLGYAVSAMFLGIGLMTHMGDERARRGEVFDGLEQLAEAGDELLSAPTLVTNTVRRRLARRNATPPTRANRT